MNDFAVIKFSIAFIIGILLLPIVQVNIISLIILIILLLLLNITLARMRVFEKVHLLLTVISFLLIALIFIILFGRFNIYLRSVLTIIGLLLFMILTGVPPSVFRATVMALVIIVAFLTNRSTNIFNSLAIAALIILIINPDEINK